MRRPLLLALSALAFGALPALGKDCVYDERLDSIVEVSRAFAESMVTEQSATGRQWFIDNHRLNLGDAAYEKFGLPRFKRLDEITYLASLDGVPLISQQDNDPEDVIYVMYSPLDCEFQAYMRVLETQ